MVEQKFEEFDAVKRRSYVQAFKDFGDTHGDRRDLIMFIEEAEFLFRWDRNQYRGRFMLNVREWCDANVPNAVNRGIRIGQMTTVLWYRLDNKDDAFAFKMRWC